MSDEDWQNSEGRALVMRRVRRREDGLLEAVTLLMNASSEPLDFRFPPPPGLERRLIVDSASPGSPEREVKDQVLVRDRSVMLVAGTGSGR